MKIVTNYQGHCIEITRMLSYAELKIDSKIADLKNGFLSIYFSSFELNGKTENNDGTSDEVKVKVKLGFLEDKVSVFYNGQLVDTKKTAI